MGLRVQPHKQKAEKEAARIFLVQSGAWTPKSAKKKNIPACARGWLGWLVWGWGSGGGGGEVTKLNGEVLVSLPAAEGADTSDLAGLKDMVAERTHIPRKGGGFGRGLGFGFGGGVGFRGEGGIRRLAIIFSNGAGKGRGSFKEAR